MKKGQVWVETVIYTLIGLSIMGVILAIVAPKIQETKDKTIIDQSIEILDSLSRDIDEIKFAPGNSWPVQLKFDKGMFVVNGETDEVYFLFENSKIAYSEEGVEITRGKVKIMTNKTGKDLWVKIGLNYSRVLNITYDGLDKFKAFQAAALPYDLTMESKGKDSTTNLSIINFNA